MSGGHFQYKQWEIGNIADEVEQIGMQRAWDHIADAARV
jgi:hypothetical protein